jgi:plastocyanin
MQRFHISAVTRRRAVWRRGALRLDALAAVTLAAALLPAITLRPASAQVIEVTTNAEFPYRFEPASVTVPVGATVRWSINGAAPHTVTAEGCVADGYGACAFDSGVAQERWLRAGTPVTSFEHTFAEAGVYRYLCRLHGQPGGIGQSGTVIVQAAGSPPAMAAPPPPVRTGASIAILAPADGEVISGGRVPVRLRVDGASVRPAVSGTIDPRFGHFHLLLDITHPLQEEFPPRRDGLYHVAEEIFTLEDVAPGAHTLTVVWGFDNHNPAQPPITATVRFTNVATSDPAAAPVRLPAAGTGASWGGDQFSVRESTIGGVLLVSTAVLGCWAARRRAGMRRRVREAEDSGPG